MRSSIVTLFSVLGFAAFATANPMGVPGANVPTTPDAPATPDLNLAALPGVPAITVPAAAVPALPDTPSLATLSAIFDAFHKDADAKISELSMLFARSLVVFSFNRIGSYSRARNPS